MPNASVSPASTRATTSASGGAPLTSMRPAWRLGRHATGWSRGLDVANGNRVTDPAGPLPSREVTPSPQPPPAAGNRQPLQPYPGPPPVVPRPPYAGPAAAAPAPPTNC